MSRFFLAVLFALSLPLFSRGAEPVYAEDFQNAEVGKTPKDFVVISGDFRVQEDGGNRFLELPGAPLDTFGVLFGPAEMEGMSVTGKFFGTKKGRKFPAFGLSLNGAGGYRVQVSAAKEKLEIFKGDEVRTSVPYQWVDATWVSLRIQARKAATGGWVIEGKVWPAAEAEPEKWNIVLEESVAPVGGRPGLWGSPFSGTPIRFDDLVVTPVR